MPKSIVPNPDIALVPCASNRPRNDIADYNKWCPYKKSPCIWGRLLGPLILGDSHVTGMSGFKTKRPYCGPHGLDHEVFCPGVASLRSHERFTYVLPATPQQTSIWIATCQPFIISGRLRAAKDLEMRRRPEGKRCGQDACCGNCTLQLDCDNASQLQRNETRK